MPSLGESEKLVSKGLSTPPSPLRLALVAHRFQRNDGQGRVNYEVALAALEQGVQLTLLAAFCADEIATHPNARFVRLGSERLPTQLLRNVAFANQSARWLQKHRKDLDLVQANGFITWAACDVVTAHFVHTSWAKSPCYPYARPLRPYALYQRAFTALNARWERRAFRSARQIIAVSEVVARDVQQLGVPAERTQVIYNGVDTTEFAPGAADRPSFGLPIGVPLALFVGDIRSPRKNLETLLRAVVRLPSLHLAVAGDAEGSPAPALAQSLGIASRVHFVGKTPRIAVLMRSVDLFVFPSRYEAHPLVVLEAMASGLPILLSKNVGSVSSFGDLVDVLQDPEDEAALAAQIAALLSSPERMQTMGAQARERALALRWSETTQAYLRVYEALRGTSPLPHMQADVR